MRASDAVGKISMGVRERLAGKFGWDEYERAFECLDCGTSLEVEYHTCPECGSFSVDRRM